MFRDMSRDRFLVFFILRNIFYALYVGDWPVSQLWLFSLVPIIGACLGALIYKFVGNSERAEASS